jgi:ABC-type transporter Mla subunit MlaD
MAEYFGPIYDPQLVSYLKSAAHGVRVQKAQVDRLTKWLAQETDQLDSAIDVMNQALADLEGGTDE